MNYNFNEIENKWQNYWFINKTFKTTENPKKPFYYVLDMYPYPSGAGLHVGHPAGYIATDIIARIKKMQGHNVLHPMGFDAFGLPAEQYAIKTGNHPNTFTKKNIQNMRQQLMKLGFSYDWDKEVDTSDPEYFKWTQWIFQQLYKHDLAELKKVEVNWCEELQTVLANSEIITDNNGNTVSERGNFLVVKKFMKQWVLKITKYADKLYDGLKNIDWLDSTKNMQRNWIYSPDKKKLLLHDWLFSRQRYWGEPFPLYYCDNEIKLIPFDQLPLKLPFIKDFQGKDGKPALANSSVWVKEKYDLNTMPTFAGSSWYFIAYILKDENGYLPLNSPEAKAKLKLWLPVDFYVGGTEHTVGHLLYARFWNMFLHDLGISPSPEPFQKLVHQGLILGLDGKKMSKSKGNVVNPNKIISDYGADTLRAYIVFMGPFEEKKSWNDGNLKGIYKWLNKIYDVFTKKIKIVTKVDQSFLEKYNYFVKKTHNLFEKLKFNNVVAELMVFLDLIKSNKYCLSQTIAEGFLKTLNPICPHISEELWSLSGFSQTIANSTWTEFDEKLLSQKTVTIALQINGKFKIPIVVNHDINQKGLEKIIMNNPNYNKYLKNFKTNRVIFVPKKIINFIGDKND